MQNRSRREWTNPKIWTGNLQDYIEVLTSSTKRPANRWCAKVYIVKMPTLYTVYRYSLAKPDPSIARGNGGGHKSHNYIVVLQWVPKTSAGSGTALADKRSWILEKKHKKELEDSQQQNNSAGRFSTVCDLNNRGFSIIIESESWKYYACA